MNDDDSEIGPPPRWYGAHASHPAGPGPGEPAPVRPADPFWAAGADEVWEPGARPHADAVGDAAARGAGGAPGWLLEPDASVGEVSRAAGSAFFGRDLVTPGLGLWPFGARARHRRARAQLVAEEGRRRRTVLRESFAPSEARAAPAVTSWRPVTARSNAMVIASLVAVVAVVFTLAWWFGTPPPTPEPAPASASAPTTPAPVAAPSSSTSTTRAPVPGATELPERPPIPTSGVAAISPPEDRLDDPDQITVLDPPVAEPGPAELSSPEGAMAAWLARLCPYSYSDEFGAAEQRARAAMTPDGWARLDPSRNDRARASWEQIRSAREVARCSVPATVLSPEAPRSPTSAIVIAQIDQVITAGSGARWVEPLSHTRIVLRGDDGLWRVDTATAGG